MAVSRSNLSGDVKAAGIGVAIGLFGIMAYSALAPVSIRTSPTIAQSKGWTETAWPFAVDPWWPSRAFSCPAATCGADVTLLVRAKLGFCNCATGVADDDELERIADFRLISGTHAPVADGRTIVAAGLNGRARLYRIEGPTLAGGSGSALLIGVNDRCDAIVATAAIAGGSSSAVERSIIQFLDSPAMRGWAEKTLGL